MNGVGKLPSHLSSLGFSRNPFPQTPDADCYFRTEQIAQHSLEAFHCLKVGKGFVLLTGEVGTGKSTFLRCLMDDLIKADCAVSFVFNTFLQGRNLLLALNRDFGIAPGIDMADDIRLLNQYLIEQFTQEKCCVLVIDDAQNLDSESLELLRLLSSLETRQHKLIQIVLSGQPELLELLHKNECRQLASRIVQHIQFHPFSISESVRYVDFRISRAGIDGGIILTSSAQLALQWHSKGNPRRIHTILDRCLYGLVPRAHQKITLGLINMGAREGGIAPAKRKLFTMPIGIGLLVVSCVAIALGFQGVQSENMAIEESVNAKPTLISNVKNSFASLTDKKVSEVSKVNTMNEAKINAVNKIEQAKKMQLLTCLKQYKHEHLFNDLENGLDVVQRRKTLQNLARSQLALAFLPSGMRLPETYNKMGSVECTWSGATGSWVVWKPAQLPFELDRDAGTNAIAWLQEQLTKNKLYVSKIDGIYGPQTLNALSRFQRLQGIPVDSNVDAWTLFLLEHDIGRINNSM
jgi:type II secretory pathway predicted ATPase ExeA